MVFHAGGGAAGAAGAERQQTSPSWVMEQPRLVSPLFDQDASGTRVDAPRRPRRHRPAVRDTSGVCCACLLLGRVQSRRGHRQVPRPRLSIQRLDQLPTAVLTDRTLGAWLTRWCLGRLAVHEGFPGQGARGVPQERAALGQFRLAHPVGQEAKVAQSVEAARRHVEHETPQEFYGIEREGPEAVTAPVVRVAEGDLAVFQGDKPVVGEGDAVGITSQVWSGHAGGLGGALWRRPPIPCRPRQRGTGARVWAQRGPDSLL